MNLINLINISLIGPLKVSILTLGLLGVFNQAFASCNYEDFQGWKDCFVEDKLSHKLGSVNVDTFKQANYVEKVIILDRKQPEKKFNFDQYLKIIDFKGKVKRGKDFYLKHQDLLNEISEKYNVDAGVIVALIGMESDYGTRQGTFNIIDALATLAYEGRRKEFFEKELINALMISKNEDISYDQLKGSWAGAMGQCQFMPSSYLSYAIDHNEDGFKDIWQSSDDVLASAANYLAKNGWKLGANVVKKTSHNELKNAKCTGSGNQICEYNQQYNLIYLKESANNSDYFIVGKNFKVLMKWNRSIYFGLATLMIANQIH